jgi:hypothetical protein
MPVGTHRAWSAANGHAGPQWLAHVKPNGGGFFGVPLVNFLGWTLTVYLFMQVFARYLRSRGPLPAAQPDRPRPVTCREYCFTRRRRSRSSRSSSPASAPPSPTLSARHGAPVPFTRHRSCAPSTECSSSLSSPCCVSPSGAPQQRRARRRRPTQSSGGNRTRHAHPHSVPVARVGSHVVRSCGASGMRITDRFFQAGGPDFSPNAAAATGRCAAPSTAA